MRHFPAVAILTASFAAAAPVRADQLQCNDFKDAERAQTKVVAGALAIAYCSLCDDRAQVMRVVSSEVVQDCSFELEVTGELLLQTQPLREGSFNKRTPFSPAQGVFKKRVDLAYFYVEVSPNKFKWLGGVIGLRAQVNTKTIQLPAALYRSLGSGGPTVGEDPPPAARTKISQLGFSLFRGGPLGKAVKAFDAGRLDDAQQAAEQALSGLARKAFARVNIAGALDGETMRTLVESALRDRLRYASRPLTAVHVGAELMLLEKLPANALEQTVAILAVWSAIHAFREESVADLDDAAVSLVTDPRTLHALQRRAPLAAQLARFYGALFHLALGTPSHQTDDVKLLAQRIAEYFDERRGLSGNYSRVLKRLTQ